MMPLTVTKIAYFLIQITIIVKSQITFYEGDECKMMNSKTGECRKDIDCPTFSSNRNNITHLRNWKSLYNLCGFDGDTPLLCCPDRSKPRKSILQCEIYSESIKNFIKTRPQILGGTETYSGEFPHMAAIGTFEESNNKINYRCGGSLISDRFILTAAHCIRKYSSRGIDTVKLGGIDLDAESPIYGVEHIFVHPKYKSSLKYDDIALIRLNRSVDTFYGYLHPACLYTENNNPGFPLTITGWGLTNLSESSRSSLLLKADLEPVAHNDCLNVFNTLNDVSSLPLDILEQQLCAKNYYNRSDTCRGDSGGPIQVRSLFQDMWDVVGITSFGRVCGEEVPSVYTRVSSYLDWIEQIVWPN